MSVASKIQLTRDPGTARSTAASAARLPRLAEVGSPRPIVHVTGGAAVDVLHRDWPPPPGGGRWRRLDLPKEATLAGVSVLTARAAEHGR